MGRKKWFRKSRSVERYWWECVAPGIGVVLVTTFGKKRALAFYSSMDGAPEPAQALAEKRIMQYKAKERRFPHIDLRRKRLTYV